MFELLGFKHEAVQPTVDLFVSLVHPEDRPSFEGYLRKSSSKSKSEAHDYRLRVGDLYRWFRVRSFVQFDPTTKEQYVIGSIEDIHDHKIAEERNRTMNVVLENEIQRRTEQLEIANRAKTRFLANMSHELRTPLGLVLGFSELLNENKNLDPETKEYVDLINKNGEILSRVINDLLDLSKIEAGKLRFQYSKVPLTKMIEDLQKMFAERAPTKDIRLQFNNFCGPNEVVVTDEIRLKQIAYNLLSNALKFTDHGTIQVNLGKQNRIYFIDVVDSGIGIPESEKDQIFDEFARGEMADSGRTAGTGLGLRLAQNLAQALGGNVELVSSQVGKGSHFRFTFVSDEGRLQQQTERRQEVSVSSKLNDFEVFVLDDNEDNIRLAEIFLKKLGCRVRGFTSAKSLFAEIVSAEPDLILLDINMPEMNGFEVFDHLRQSGYKNPIWALTAYSLNEDIQAILDYGFDDFIRKPITIDSMKRKLTFELRERTND
jgi:signal transduction histidine kinase/ActR/RegA family two-component response regulator